MQHTLNLYVKPIAGNGYIRRFPIYNYSHSIISNGWFDSAQGDIYLHSESEAILFLEQYIGNRVAIFADNPGEACWEGLINRATFNAGKTAYTISLEEMINRVDIKYTEGNVSPSVVATLTASNDAASQAIYGVKHGQMEFGFKNSAGTPSAMLNLRDSLLANKAYPQSSIRPGGSGFVVHLELIGFFHTLEWEVYNSAGTSANTAISTLITGTLLPGIDNDGVFFDNTDFKAVTTNTATFPAQQKRGATFWDLFQQLAECGDSSGNGYIIGIEPTNFVRRDRRMYYRQMNRNTEYTVRMSNGLQVCNLYGKPIAPWRVVPDRGVKIADWLVGYDLPGDDPRYFYVNAVNYDGNSQSVILNSDDDPSLQGRFDLKRAYKRYGKKFGARIRVSEA